MEHNLDLLLDCFNRFANYLETNNSQILVKIENEKILFCNNYQPDYNNIYQLWFLFTVESLKTQIEYFFFGYGIVNQCSIFLAFEGMDLLKPFGKPSCLEELMIKMDLLGI
jgi:hypothetical protein